MNKRIASKCALDSHTLELRADFQVGQQFFDHRNKVVKIRRDNVNIIVKYLLAKFQDTEKTVNNLYRGFDFFESKK